MTLDQIINLLEEVREIAGGDAPVFLAHQPNWPFQFSITDVTAVDLNAEERVETQVALQAAPAGSDEHRECTEHLADLQPDWKIYVVEGSEQEYLPGVAAKAIGW